MINIGQKEIIEFLSNHKGRRYTADQLKTYLRVGSSIYVPLRKIRDNIEAGHEKNIKCDIRLVKRNFALKAKEFEYWWRNSNGN